jgi:pimeloyl-ACP methyl ester carboxylesterase
MRTVAISTAILGALSLWPAAARSMPCRGVTCPGEIGKEGSTGGSTSGGMASGDSCPSQTGPDCPHSCPKADPGTCPSSTEVTYLSLDDVPKTDLRATCDAHGKNCKVKLVGDLFVPAAGKDPAKKFPVVIYNHGSVNPGCDTCKHTPEPPCAIARTFVSEGYLVFMPHRRGYTPSTGVNQAGPLKDEAADVVDALKYLEKHQGKVADTTKVALVGHSLGGIASIYANETDFGQTAVVSIAGGSESWCGNPKLHDTLKAAVVAAKSPIYFLEPKDDVSTMPTIELSHDMGLVGDRFQAAIFGPVANDDDLAPIHCGSQAHVCFTKDSYQVGRWAPSVLEWLHRFGVK